MSDEGEKNCPLCAEEMDLTDQQLKPCKCGYEICVWCWHHLMDMAEKDGTEGRCPACRTPYNKEKIVGMASSCERIVAGMNVDRKGKLQKAKSKPSEGRKHLTSVRVIQRNLVYIVGLPLNLADEDLLERREYFCQYGKVLKVSISRTAAGSIQQFANNTCSVYITYSKEEDAVRCIQSVHGFVLDGSCLRACFGTTKYCHAWLRNMPCSNPECLYLHEIGTQEDSFTKDEIISAYTRSRVQQITGATINMQRRSGNVLPPPADEHCTNGSATSEKPITKSASNNPATSVRSSPPNSSSSRSAPLPSTAAAAASWGPHASNCHQPPTSLVCANGPSKQKPETCSVSTAIASTTRVPLLNDDVQRKLIPCEEGQTILRRGKQEALEPDTQVGIAPTTASEGLPVMSTLTGQLHNLSASEDKDRRISAAPPIINSFELSGRSNSHVSDKDQNVSPNGNVQNVWSDMAKLKSDHLGGQYSGDTSPNSSHADKGTLGSDQISNSVAREDSDWRSYTHAQVANTDSQVAFPEVEEDSQYFEDQRLKDPEVLSRTRYLPNSSTSFIISNPSGFYSPQQTEPYGSTSFNVNTQTLDKKFDKGSILHPSGVPRVPNGFPEDIVSTSVHSDRTVDDLYLLPLDLKKKHVGRFEGEAVNADQNTSIGNGESSIISNILSMDFDSWDESLTSPQTLAKLLGENERRQGSLKLSSSWKVQNSNQSRFSFARQEECRNQISGGEPSFSNAGQLLKDRPLSHNFPESRYFNFDKHGDSNGFSTSNFEESDNFSSSHSPTSNKLFVSRAQMSVPPGFSVPSRAPPPGFTTQGIVEPTFDTISGNHFLDPSSLLRNTYQVPPTENISGDIEFMDPAILAVGKERFPAGLNNAAGVRPNYPSQLDAFENEASLQLFMQRSLPPLQNPGFSDVGNGFSLVSDAYRTPSRMMEQTQTHNPSLFPQLSLQQSRTALMSNGQWGSWNDVHSGNDRGMADLLRTEILEPNKLYTGYEDSKFRMPSSGDLYNSMYGI